MIVDESIDMIIFVYDDTILFYKNKIFEEMLNKVKSEEQKPPMQKIKS
jgi:hypothetical protein